MTTHLPVVGSSAATTTFCVAELEGRDGRKLYIDGNRKITAGNGTYKDPKPNAFSLVQIEDCPDSTPTCRASCYVHGLEAAAKSTHDLYRHNSKTIREILAAADGIGFDPTNPDAVWWGHHFAAWITEHAAGGFRWHVSGDLFAPEYAWWVANVVALSPTVRHWIYTRSHYMSASFVDPRTGAMLPNIAVNYSVDRDNYELSRKYVEAHAAIGAPVRLCYMVTGDGAVPSDLPEGSVLFPDYSLRGARNTRPAEQRSSSTWYQSLTSAQRRMVCPVDFYGKSDGTRCGPCSKCLDIPE